MAYGQILLHGKITEKKKKKENPNNNIRPVNCQ